MAYDVAMRLPRPARYAFVGAGIVAAWYAFGQIVGSRAVWSFLHALGDLAEQRFGDTAERAVQALVYGSIGMTQLALLGATLMAPIAMLIRAQARMRFRGLGIDILEPLRRTLATRTWRARALTWGPAAAAALVLLASRSLSRSLAWPAVVALLPPALALAGLIRAYLVLLASPPAREEDLVTPATSDDDLFFSAVAVTREARGLVAAFAAANVAFVAAVLMLPITARHVWAFAAFALLGVFAFRRASRIAVGLDGVLVMGTSRRRFFGYRDLDAAEVAASGDIILRRGRREVLRLQLSGDDVPRLAAIVDRIRAGIARARDQAGDVAQRFAETANAAALSQAAHGHAHYRGRAASREDLLALVESPATDAAARAAAAGALGRAADADERQRLRVAAGLCAEPEARAVLLRVAGAAPEAEAEESDPEAAPAPRRATMSR